MKKRLVLYILLLFIVSLLYVGCGGAGSKSDETGAAYPSAQAPEVMLDANKPTGVAGEYASDSPKPSEAGQVNPAKLKIIYTANITIQSEQWDQSYEQLMKLLEQSDGYMQNSQIGGGYTTGGGYYNLRSATLTLRIPADRYRAFVDSAGSIGTVTNLSENTDDITASYIDTEARLKSLKAQETRLLALMETAETVADTIEIESRLSDVRYQIESYQSQMNFYDNQLGYSTITIYLEEVKHVTDPQYTFGQRIVAAVNGSIRSAGQFLEDFAVFMIYALPYIVILLVILIFVLLITRKGRQQRKERRDVIRRANAGALTSSQGNPYVSSPTADPGDQANPPQSE